MISPQGAAKPTSVSIHALLIFALASADILPLEPADAVTDLLGKDLEVAVGFETTFLWGLDDSVMAFTFSFKDFEGFFSVCCKIILKVPVCGLASTQ